MNIIESSYEILTPIDGTKELELIEKAGRTCYKSENNIEEGSAEKFISGIVKSGHESVLEHSMLSVRFICDRGVSHEIVRHRLASYSQESTRYCNYSKDKFGKELTFIKPNFSSIKSQEEKHKAEQAFCSMCQKDEYAYFDMIGNGAKPQEARSILPNCLKTEIVMTANYREWRHFLKLRTSKAAHPDIRALVTPLLKELQEKLPCVFSDIAVEE